MKIAFLFITLISTLQGADAPFDWKLIDAQTEAWRKMPEAELRQKVEAGDAVAKYFMALRIRTPRTDDPAVHARATQLLAEASDAGVPQAINAYALRLRDTDGAKYIALLETAARSGSPESQADLAEEHLEGVHTSVDEGRAVELMRRAADAGHRGAIFELAEMYASGMGEPRHDGETPFQLYQAAARLGASSAALPLGRRYRYGIGTEQDLMEAARWYWRGPRHELDQLLDEAGEPRLTLEPEAAAFAHFLSLYVKANRFAKPEMMLQLGQAFMGGAYGKKNFLAGYIWLTRAARAGQPGAAQLAATAKTKLSPAEIEAAEKELATILMNRPIQPRPRQ